MSLSSSNFFCGTRNKTFTNSLLWKTDVDFSERLYKTNMSASLPVTKAICFAFLNQLQYTIIEVDAAHGPQFEKYHRLNTYQLPHERALDMDEAGPYLLQAREE